MKKLITSLVLFTGLIAVGGLSGSSAQEPAPMIYAITGARIVPVSGAPIDNGTIVLRNGLIADLGASVTPPAGAIRIDGKGLTVYPGLIDMSTSAGIDAPAAPRAENPQTTEDLERAKRLSLLRPQLRAADHMNPAAQPLTRLAAAGITSVLATPAGPAIRGQSALVNTTLGADAPQIGAVADERRGHLIVKTPVALHVSFSSNPGGGGYPASLMGVIAFVRQTFLDAQHYQTAVQHAERVKGSPRPVHDPVFEALQPALAGRIPVAFEAAESREILRALDMAKAFKFDPIVTNAREADEVAADLKSANARVILSLNFPTRSTSLAPDADESLATLRGRANAPKVPAALTAAGVMFAFGSDGLSEPRDFLRNVSRSVQNGLARDAALRALTLNAATIAGAADRLGSLETGKIANVLVTEGDLFDEKTTIKHVFVDGRPVNLDAAPAAQGGRGGRGGGR